MQNATAITDFQTEQSRAEALAAVEQAYEYYSDEEYKLAPDYAYQEYPDAA